MDTETSQRVETFPFKRLLTPVRYEEDRFFLTDYTMNLYRGCNHGCLYCDTRSECYRIDHFDQIRHKENCIDMLREELRQKRKPGVVALGAASDSYNAVEKELCLTRQALELLKKYSFGVGLHTKGALARDGPLLAEMGRQAPTYVAFSITTVDDGLARLLEPGAPPASGRFAAMKELARAGVFTGTWMNPMVPYLTDSRENLVSVLEQTKENGGRFVLCHFGMTLRTGNREYFYAALEAEPRFRGVKERFVSAFGLDYFCPSPRAGELYAVFKETCERLGLLCSFGEVNRALLEQGPRQMTLW
jgi:DNA repair photolyase